MSDYVRQNDFSIKDALPSGSSQKIIKGADVDAEFDALVPAIASKLDDIPAATTGNVPLIGSSGTTLTDSGYSLAAVKFPLINVMSYGATGDGVTDDTDALKAAVAAALAVNGTVFVPAGVYVYSDKFAEITESMALVGEGSEQTIFTPSGYTGFAIRLNDCWRDTNGEEVIDGSTLTAPRAGALGVRLQGFQILGDRTAECHGIQFVDRNDTVIMQDVKLKFLNGHALELGVDGPDSKGLVRESSFYDVRVQQCGSSTAEAILITTGTTTGDGTNQLYFYHCSAQYCDGIALKITSNHATQDTRRIAFYGFMLHGRYNDASASANHLCVIEGAVYDIHFYGLNITGSSNVGGTAYAAVRIQEDASHNIPNSILIYGDARTCEGNVYDVQNGNRISINGTMGGSDIAGYELVVGSGAASAEAIQYNVVGPEATRTFSIDATQQNRFMRSIGAREEFPIRMHSGGIRLGSSGVPPGVFFGSGSPEGTITAYPGSVYVNIDTTAYMRAQNTLWIKATGISNTGWRKVLHCATALTSNLADITDEINTLEPQTGQMVFNTTTGIPVWKSGDTAGAVWVDATGTTAHTPS